MQEKERPLPGVSGSWTASTGKSLDEGFAVIGSSKSKTKSEERGATDEKGNGFWNLDLTGYLHGL